MARSAAARGGTALVTGAAKGIGEACVQRLAEHGWQVYAGVRAEQDAERWRRDPGSGVTPLLFDVTDPQAIAAAVAAITAQCGDAGLDALVNNAGLAVPGPLELLPLELLRRQLEVNVVGQLAVTQACLPLLRRARGRIIFMSSVSGRSALPFAGAYAASKFALEAVADALRVELRPWRIRVVLVEPGVVLTPIWQTALATTRDYTRQLPSAALQHYGAALDALERRHAHGMRGLRAEAVARVVERALEARSPRARYVVGRQARARLWIEALLPTKLRDAIAGGLVQRLVRGERRADRPR